MKLLKIGKPLLMNGFMLQVNDQEALELIISLSEQMRQNSQQKRAEDTQCELVSSDSKKNELIYFSIAVNNSKK